MKILDFLDQNPLVGIAITIFCFVGFILGLIVGGKYSWAQLGTFSSFFKQREYFILKKVVGDGYESEKIYLFQRVKTKNNPVTYSREFYLRKDSNFSLWGDLSEGITENIIFEVRTLKKDSNGKISSLEGYKFKTNLPKENIVVS